MKKLAVLTSLMAFFFLSACATPAACKNGGCGKDPNDPYEKTNRETWVFDQTVDKLTLKPAAQVYHAVLPKFARDGIHHVYRNVGLIPTTINDVLQGNLAFALHDTWRFVINSTVGIFGIFDVGKKIGLEDRYPTSSNAFGVTLAKWGFRKSNYLVLPFLGPSTVRDAVAYPESMYMSVFPYINPFILRAGLVSLNFVDERSGFLDLQKDLEDSVCLGPVSYECMRSVYTDARNNEIDKAVEGGD